MGILPEPIGAPRAEVIVLGSGPGGAITACLLAEAGRDVLLVEEGAALALDDTVSFSREEMRRKYRNGGVTVALGNPSLAYAEGRCLGGGSEVNSGLYHRTPPEILERWQREFGLSNASEADLSPHFEANEKDLSVSLLPGDAPAASLLLRDGAAAHGWRSMEVPRWYRYEAGGGAHRQSMTETFLPRAIRAGCRVTSQTRARRLRRDGKGFTVECTRETERGPSSIELEAPTVVVACGAVQTPALLRRSGIRKNVGSTLHFHPTVKVVARFRDRVNEAGMGVPVHQVKEFSPDISLGCSISQPHHLALAMVDHPTAIEEVLDDWEHYAVYYAMTGGGSGAVHPLPVFRDPLVRFGLTGPDLADLSRGLRRLCECLLAAGADRLYPSVRGLGPFGSEADLGKIPSPLPRGATSLMTIHAFASCPMGENAARTAADSYGRVHDVPGLRIADASLLCSPPGVNPQGSIMAIARRNALEFLGDRS